MPLYEYECRACGRRTEKIQKFSDPELTVCPHCSGALERTLTAPAVQFKGSGWYKDLYSSAKPAAAGNGDKAAANGADSTASKPADSSTPAAPGASATSSASSSTSSSTSTTAAPGKS
jgi:putative FmdB family regulatory protein